MGDMGLYGGSEAIQAARLSLEILEEFLGTPLKAAGKWLFLDGNALRGIKWTAGMMQKGYFLAAQDGAVSVKWILRNQGLDNQILRIPNTTDYESFRKDLLKMGVKFAETSPMTLKGERAILFNSQYASVVGQLLKMGTYKDIRISNISDLEQDMPDKEVIKEGIQERQSEVKSKKKISKNPNMECVTINETLLKEEADGKIKTRIPGKPEEYVWLESEDFVKINHGKTLFAGLEKEREYAVVNAENEPLRSVSGRELYKNYDPVSKTEVKQGTEDIPITKEQEKAAKEFLRGPENKEIVNIPHTLCSIKEIDKEILLALKKEEGTPVFYWLEKEDLKVNNKDGIVLSLKEDITQYSQGKRIPAKREELKKIIKQGIPKKAGGPGKTKIPEATKKR